MAQESLASTRITLNPQRYQASCCSRHSYFSFFHLHIEQKDHSRKLEDLGDIQDQPFGYTEPFIIWFLPTLSNPLCTPPPPLMTWKILVPSSRLSLRFMGSEKPFLHPFLSPHPHLHGSGLFPPAATLGPVQTSLREALSWAELCSPKVVLEF